MIQTKNCLLLFIFFFCSNIQATVFEPLSSDIQEPLGIYYPSVPDILKINVQTVVNEGPCVLTDYSGCTLEDVNNNIDTSNNFKPEVKVRFIADDFLDDGKISNATLRLRGNSSRRQILKSYRIKLDKKNELWRGERRLQLNKHLSDLTRVRNKLSFDLMATIPHLPSLRTQFVSLFINGIDHGLYTHVEHVGKEYLMLRDWDKDSNVYKAKGFDFTMSSELLLNSEGKPLDEDFFETVLDIKRGDEHSVLLKMIAAVNNENNDFKTDVLDKYFNLNNFLTWEAMNILMGNNQVTTDNYYLLNPKNTDMFYFLPWDFDSTWGYDWQPSIVEGKFATPKRYQGPHNLWSTAFGKRFLLQPEALDLLNQAVKEIKENHLTPEIIASYTNSYYDLVFPLISQSPDLDNLSTNQRTTAAMFAEYNEVYQGLIDSVQLNYDRFLKSQHSPMPFHMYSPILNESNILFTWEAAIDLQGDTVTYDLEISDKPEFAPGDIKFSINNLTGTSYATQWMLPAGDYFYKVTARDASNPKENWQLSFSEYSSEDIDFIANGIEPFTVDISGHSPEPVSLDIIIDGKRKDWKNVSFWTDFNDIKPKKSVDWRKAWFAQDHNNIYIAYLNDSKILKNKLWAWSIYLDTDDNSMTGYQVGSIGAEYLLEGRFLWKYTGNGEDWSWEKITEVEYAIKKKFAELSIPKNALNNSSKYKILLYGANNYLDNNAPVDLMLIQPN